MKTLNFILVICCIFILSCGQKSDQPKSSGSNTDESNKSPQSTTAEQTNKEKPASDNSEADKKESSNRTNDIRVNFPTGATQVTLNGTIDGFSQSKTYVFEVSKGQKLTASVKPNPATGNIRIAQIINPAGQSDGPFGNQMTYALNESGDWKLVLNENMMSGDPWKGEYFLTIEIK